MRSLLILAGPTASGKTSVCLEIAKKIPVETISFDSMQVYRGLPIVTQAPSAAQKKALRAHLVSFLDPSRMFDAANFRVRTLTLLEKIQKRKRVPLLSGGTGLYLRMLLDGLFESEGDSRAPRLREKLLRAQEKRGGSYLHHRLGRVDPESALKIHPNDHRRLVRALEVYELSGKPLSRRQTDRRGIRGDYHCPVFFLERDRADLYARIERRVDAMVKQGLVKEVERALKKKLSPTASMALGIREIGAYLNGNAGAQRAASLHEAIASLKQHTRNYAKRQLSWFRHEKGVVGVGVAPDEKPKETARKILGLWESSKEGVG